MRSTSIEYGYKFRRQFPFGTYILDFYCEEKQLVVEIDGGQHNNEKNRIYDDHRSNYLKIKGMKILRFWDNDVLNSIDLVLDTIYEALICSPRPHPNPLLQGEGNKVKKDPV